MKSVERKIWASSTGKGGGERSGGGGGCLPLEIPAPLHLHRRRRGTPQREDRKEKSRGGKSGGNKPPST